MSDKRQAAVPFVLFSVFMDVLGIGLIIPVLPTLIAQFTDTRDAQAHWYGILAASYGLMQFIAAPALGALSDRFGRRPVLLLSMLGLGADFLLLAHAPSLGFMLVARIVGGLTGASFSVASAYVADVTPPETRGKSLGLIGAAFGIGFIFGPVIGGVLGNIDVRLPFYVAAALSALNALYGFFILPESLPPENRTAFSFARANPFVAILNLTRLRAVGTLVAAIALTVLAQLILQSSWVLFTTFRFDWTPRDNGIALFIVGVVAAGVQGGLMGTILKHLGDVRTVIAGMISSTVALTLYGSVQHGWMMYVIIFANFMTFAAGPALQGLISKAVDPREQGISMGALNSLSSVMGVIAPLLGSVLLAQSSHLPHDDWRVGSIFYIAAFLQLLGLILAWRHFSAQRHLQPA